MPAATQADEMSMLRLSASTSACFSRCWALVLAMLAGEMKAEVREIESRPRRLTGTRGSSILAESTQRVMTLTPRSFPAQQMPPSGLMELLTMHGGKAKGRRAVTRSL